VGREAEWGGEAVCECLVGDGGEGLWERGEPYCVRVFCGDALMRDENLGMVGRVYVYGRRSVHKIIESRSRRCCRNVSEHDLNGEV